MDVLGFIERSWCFEFFETPSRCKVSKDNVAVAEFDNYEDWLRKLPKETKARLAKAQVVKLEVKVVNPNAPASLFDDSKEGVKLAKGIWEIYNETPVRQARRFRHYGMSLKGIQHHVFATSNIFLGAYLWVEEGFYLKHKLVGFAELQCGDCTGAFAQILSLTSYRDVMPNNALIAKAVEVCSDRGLNWLVYARMGNHPSLDEFKKSNGFKKYMIKHYYVPLSVKGKVAVLLGLHRDLKDVLPSRVKRWCIPFYNWVSRVRLKVNAV